MKLYSAQEPSCIVNFFCYQPVVRDSVNRIVTCSQHVVFWFAVLCSREETHLRFQRLFPSRNMLISQCSQQDTGVESHPGQGGGKVAILLATLIHMYRAKLSAKSYDLVGLRSPQRMYLLYDCKLTVLIFATSGILWEDIRRSGKFSHFQYLLRLSKKWLFAY